MMDKNESSEEVVHDVLNILQKFGKYQIVHYFLIFLPTMFSSMNNVNYVFVAGDIDYRCRVPECESLENKYLTNWWPNKDMDRCTKPVLNYTLLQANQCTNNSFTSTVNKCEQWVYGSNNTIVAWLDLACQPWKTNFVGTMHSLGMVFGMMLGGWCSDRFGRKPTLIVSSMGIIVGTLKTLMSSYYAYIFVEFVEATLCGSAFTAGMVLIIEISGNDKRALSGVIFAYAIYSGEALLVGIAILVPYWKTMIYLACGPPVLFISYINLVNESPRWQVLNDKIEEARNTLKSMARVNKIKVNPQDIDNLNKEQLGQACSVEVNVKKEGYKEVFKCKEMVKRVIVVIIGRFSVTLIYFGMVANSVWLPGDKYTNYILAAFISFPGDILALYFMDKVGRKWPLVYGYLVCGVTCVIFAYVPGSLSWLKILLFLIAKLIVTACYTGLWTYTMELFPTSVRGSLFGLCTFAASAGWMLAPLTPAMVTISPVFASLLFGCSAALASALLVMTPETKGLPLVGTVEEVVNSATDTNQIQKKARKSVNLVAFDENGVLSIHL